MKRIFQFFILLCFFNNVFAHDYGGEITYQKVSGFTFKFRLTLYIATNLNYAGTKRLLSYGDGITDTVFKTNEILTDSLHLIYKVDFEGSHTYADTGIYVVFYTISNRPPDIINVNGGNSVNEPLYIEDSIFIRNPQLFPFDYSPTFSQYQTDINFDGDILTHNSNITENDADSITYELISPLKGSNIPVGNYILPNLVPGTPFGQTFEINDTGLIVWETPVFCEKYCVAIRATLWKYGLKMGTLIRDMLIVVDCNVAVNPISQNESQFIIFPNPSHGKIMISGIYFQNGTLEISDAIGRRVMKIKGIPNEIDVSHLTTGMYFLFISNGKQFVTKKFMKE